MVRAHPQTPIRVKPERNRFIGVKAGAGAVVSYLQLSGSLTLGEGQAGDSERIPVANPDGPVHVLGKLPHAIGAKTVLAGEPGPHALRQACQTQIARDPYLTLRVLY